MDLCLALRFSAQRHWTNSLSPGLGARVLEPTTWPQQSTMGTETVCTGAVGHWTPSGVFGCGGTNEPRNNHAAESTASVSRPEIDLISLLKLLGTSTTHLPLALR